MRHHSRAAERRGDDADDLEEPLVDTTVAIPLRSKRTERKHKKKQLSTKPNADPKSLFHLPSELFLEILSYLRPSDIYALSCLSKAVREFVLANEIFICKEIVSWRYPILKKSFPRPVSLSSVSTTARAALHSPARQSNRKQASYQHISPPHPYEVCTCMTCTFAWNNLNLILDFAHFQPKLRSQQPIPIVARGQHPAWNTQLLGEHATVVRNAAHSPLAHARILQHHLRSTTLSVAHHAANASNRRRRFRMTAKDEKSETDHWLGRSGPPSTDFPWSRDHYYMLEAWVPNRGWNGQEGRWMYLDEAMHSRDIEMLQHWMGTWTDQAQVRDRGEGEEHDDGRQNETATESSAVQT
ncbi:hypothetical protein K402DRAFT_398963 [Aulographum hederae CBS 113979]|uniref:F-box domain-containing protein n=1 Tax=Aulographum hederae CBS 113979 TaxID=1176131 RepID=A0A6G1GJD8_9PEZI|nr:hypothetical protein K402DRAFT_398963 [Aulographum hederae CBS 113979]